MVLLEYYKMLEENFRIKIISAISQNIIKIYFLQPLSIFWRNHCQYRNKPYISSKIWISTIWSYKHKVVTNLGGHFLSPVWIFPLLFWMVNQIKINNVSKYLLLSDFIFFQVSNIKNWNIGKYQKFITSCMGININPIQSWFVLK